MGRREKTLVTTMTGLLALLVPGGWNSSKTDAVLRYSRNVAPEVPDVYVEEFFDDGKGHSGAFTSERTPTTPELFEQAQRQRYISGKLEPGYVSDWEFLITEEGKRAYYERRDLGSDLLKRIREEGKLHVSDVVLKPHYSHAEGLAEDVLEHFVHGGRLETRTEADKKYYYFRVRE